MALAAQRSFWMALLHDTIHFKSLQKTFAVMNAAELRASAVYRKVLERYPTNGRLLKIYGRFLEYCKNDPWTANRYYMEATKQGTGESLMALIGSGSGAKDSADSALQALGAIDEREDGLIIINASGIIMACNKPLFTMFGYDKGELENKNVSCLMPQPFSSRHNGYLSHYVQTGEARILNSTRAVVGVTKTHGIFPFALHVVKISGAGDESVFMGVARVAPSDDPNVVRLWVAPSSGAVLTADEAFADHFGINASELVGRNLSTLGPDIEALDRLVARGASASGAELESGELRLRTQLLHRFLPPMEVEITVGLGGTEKERILVLNVRSVAPPGAVMVVDHKGRLVYASSALGALLGIPHKALAAMDLQSLIPPPYSQMHGSFLKNLANVPPPTSCRSGAVVYMMRANGTKLPVTLQLSTHDDGDRVQHVVRVLPSSEADRLDRQRLVLGVGEGGVVVSVNPGAPKSLFGFAPQALVGRKLSSFVNVFRDFAKQGGDESALLAALGVRALEGANDDAWRVGVQQPKVASGAAAEEVRFTFGWFCLL